MTNPVTIPIIDVAAHEDRVYWLTCDTEGGVGPKRQRRGRRVSVGPLR